MKTLKLVLFGMALMIAGFAQSQVSVNIQIGKPPHWGVVGYPEARYYYLPDIESYYDIHDAVFIYYNGHNWIRRAHLPSRYKNYDLRNCYKVVMTGYRGNTPFIYYNTYRTRFAPAHRVRNQRIYEDRFDNRHHEEMERRENYSKT